MSIISNISKLGHQHSFSIEKPTQLKDKTILLKQSDEGLKVYIRDDNNNRVYPIEKHMIDGLPKLNCVPEEFFNKCYAVVKNCRSENEVDSFGINFRVRGLGGVRNEQARSDYTKRLVSVLSHDHPGHNVLVVKKGHKVQGIPTNVVNFGSQTWGADKQGNGGIQYEYYVFKGAATINNKGDGGYLNWCFNGKYNRVGAKVVKFN